MIVINESLSIPESEFSWSAQTSGGPGGQHVNKTCTRVVVRFNVLESPSLDEAQRALLAQRLGSRLSSEGVLQVSAQTTRSQRINRELALARCIAALRKALRQDPPRKPTRKPAAVDARRLTGKRLRGKLKSERSGRWPGTID